MSDKVVKIACGINNDNLGSLINADTKLYVESGNLVCGNMIMGSLKSLETYHDCETPTLREMHEKYRHLIAENDQLYFIDSDGLSGAIYARADGSSEDWFLFAKTAGYA